MPPTPSLGSSYVTWSVSQPESHPTSQHPSIYRKNGPQTPEDQDDPEQALTNQLSCEDEQDTTKPDSSTVTPHVSQESSHVTSQPEQKTQEKEDALEQGTINPESSAVTPLVSQVDVSHVGQNSSRVTSHVSQP